MPAGYSGTPLARKLTLRDGLRIWAPGMPARVRREIDSAGLTPTWVRQARPGLEAAHLFATSAADLSRHLGRLRSTIAPDGRVWVSWPKRASGRPTDITEDRVREIALPMGFVDVKACTVDEVWSGLKLVIRKELRTAR